MVDDTKKVEDKEDDDSSSELDLSFKTKSNKINILGQSLDWPTIIALGLGTVGALGAGYLIYDQYNKNKAIDEQKKYEQWILQQQAAMMNQPQTQKSHIPPPETGNDMVDMNTVSPTISYDRFLQGGLPSGGSRLVQSDNSRPVPVAQPVMPEPQSEAVVDMDQYSSNETTMSTVPVPRPVQRKQESSDPTTEELMASMYNNNEAY